MVDNMSKKVQTIRSDVRIARDRMLRAAIEDLAAMRQERSVGQFFKAQLLLKNTSVCHFNTFLALETEYATYGRKLCNGYNDLLNANEQLSEYVDKTLMNHDRKMLTKKMPCSLFSSTLPAIFSD